VNITAKSKKKELQKDPLVEAFNQVSEYIKNNSNAVKGVVVGVLIAVIGYFVYSSMKKANEAEAMESFGKAMSAYTSTDTTTAIEFFEKTANNYGNSVHGVMSNYMLGTIFLQRGQYEDAITHLESAAGKNNADFVGGEAQISLALAYEGAGRINDAIDAASRSLLNEKVSFRHADVRWKLALWYKNTGGTDKAISLCREITSDTLATQYYQNAKNLIAQLEYVN